MADWKYIYLTARKREKLLGEWERSGLGGVAHHNICCRKFAGRAVEPSKCAKSEANTIFKCVYPKTVWLTVAAGLVTHTRTHRQVQKPNSHRLEKGNVGEKRLRLAGNQQMLHTSRRAEMWNHFGRLHKGNNSNSSNNNNNDDGKQ